MQRCDGMCMDVLGFMFDEEDKIEGRALTCAQAAGFCDKPDLWEAMISSGDPDDDFFTLDTVCCETCTNTIPGGCEDILDGLHGSGVCSSLSYYCDNPDSWEEDMGAPGYNVDEVCCATCATSSP